MSTEITPVLKVSDVSRLLRVHHSTIYRLLKVGGIPAWRVGSDWRFRADEIERWMSERTDNRWREGAGK